MSRWKTSFLHGHGEAEGGNQEPVIVWSLYGHHNPNITFVMPTGEYFAERWVFRCANGATLDSSTSYLLIRASNAARQNQRIVFWRNFRLVKLVIPEGTKVSRLMRKTWRNRDRSKTVYSL